MQNKVIYGHICKECGNPFTMEEEEVKWYRAKGFPLPKRCRECRKKKKEAKGV